MKAKDMAVQPHQENTAPPRGPVHMGQKLKSISFDEFSKTNHITQTG